jgi:hypothetical protein
VLFSACHLTFEFNFHTTNPSHASCWEGCCVHMFYSGLPAPRSTFARKRKSATRRVALEPHEGRHGLNRRRSSTNKARHVLASGLSLFGIPRGRGTLCGIPYHPKCSLLRVRRAKVRSAATKNEDISALINELQERPDLTPKQFTQRVDLRYSTANHWWNGKRATAVPGSSLHRTQTRTRLATEEDEVTMAKLTREQVAEIKSYLDKEKDLPDDYKHVLFPPEKIEYEARLSRKRARRRYHR